MNIELIQNTHEWLEFRRKKIGASDAPVILEVSPWKTPYQLWIEKTSGTPSITTHHQKRGLELEELARQTFEKKTGTIMFPKVVLHPSFDWMMASLDGIDIDGQAIVEIKCPGPSDHESAKAGKIPEKYIPQLQHQLAVTGLQWAYYFSFDGTDGVIVEIERDEVFIAKMIELEQVFWGYIETCTPPPLNEKDFVNHEDEEWLQTSKKWLDIQSQIESLENQEKGLREHLISLADGKNSQGGGLRISRSMRKGTVQYSQIPQLKEVDLEKYRKGPSEVWRLTAI